MKRWRRFWLRLSNVVRRGRAESELTREIDAHLVLLADEYERRGLTPEAARLAARRAFGGVEQTKELQRDARSFVWLDQLRQDLRYACRSLARHPGFTGVAVLTLALGIGANTAIFTLVHAVLIERPPFRDPNRLVAIWEESSRRPGQHNVVSPANFLRWQERVTSFEPLAAFYERAANLTGSTDPEEVVVQRVTAPFFPTLGIAPLLGRTFTDEESRDPRAAVAILGYDLWQRRFGGDPVIVGRAIQLNAVPTMIVGVMPRGFGLFMRASAGAGRPADLWAPYVMSAAAREVGSRSLSVVARLKSDVPQFRAQAEMTAMAAALASEFPERDAGWTADVVTVHDEISTPYRQALLVLFGAVILVLLIACANVANLLLVRGASRRRELAVRLALGAGRGRIVRQLLTEALVLVLAGACAGLPIARVTLAGLLALNPIEFMPNADIGQNAPVLAFTILISLITTVLCGVAPALDAARVDAAERVESSVSSVGAGHRVLRDLFVVLEIALAVVLLVGAGLLSRSLESLRQVNPGFEASHLLTMRMQLPAAKYADDGRRIRFFQEAESQVRDLPGVRAAGVVAFLPFTGSARSTFTIAGQPPPAAGEAPVADLSVCDNGYIEAVGLALKQGRLFTERELHERSNVALVSESLARAYFPNEDPIGKRLIVAFTPAAPTEVVGVLADMRSHALSAAELPTIFWPHPQYAYAAMTLTVRTRVDPMSLAPAVQHAIQTIDKDQPVSDIRTMTQWIGRSLAQTRFNAALLTTFSMLALSLAAIGVYGVMSYAVARRTHELGVRVALGAPPAHILRLLLVDGVRLTVVGLLVGVGLALGLGHSLTALLFQTASTDTFTIAGAVLLLGTVAIVASLLPAHRATGVDVMAALRAD